MKLLRIFNSTCITKIMLLTVLTLTLHASIQAQSNDTSTLSNVNLYADGGFHIGFQASINVEKRICSGTNVSWYGRIGLGLAGIIMVDGGPGGLAAITMLTGKGKNHFEMNGGVFLLSSKEYLALPILDLGYRYQKPEGGFIFRAKAGILGIGISLGYAF